MLYLGIQKFRLSRLHQLYQLGMWNRHPNVHAHYCSNEQKLQSNEMSQHVALDLMKLSMLYAEVALIIKQIHYQ